MRRPSFNNSPPQNRSKSLQFKVPAHQMNNKLAENSNGGNSQQRKRNNVPQPQAPAHTRKDCQDEAPNKNAETMSDHPSIRKRRSEWKYVLRKKKQENREVVG